MNKTIIRTCPLCDVPVLLNDLVYNPDFRAIGMEFGDGTLEWVHYYFQHAVPECETTFAVGVEYFTHLIDELIPGQCLIGTADCGLHCTSVTDLSACSAECQFAPYRRLLLRIIEIKRNSKATTKT